MANLQGYGTSSVGNMLNHYTRHAGDPEQARYRYANQSIDASRTHLNYAVFARDDPASFVREQIEAADVKPKGGEKATNVISDWVITLPKNPALIGREREFFQVAYDHMLKTVPERLVVGAWVHMDENQPHMHFCFCPLVRSAVMTNDKSRPLKNADGSLRRDRKGTVRYERVQVTDAAGKPLYRVSFGQTKVYNRSRMKRFHPDLEKAMEEHFGFTVGIELEDKGDKLLSDLKQPDYIKAKETMARQHCRIKALEADEVETRGKLGALTAEVDEKRDIAAELSQQISEKTTEMADIQGRIDDFSKKEEAARQRLESVRRDVAEVESIAQKGVGALVLGARGAAAGGELGERERAAGERNQELRGRVADLRAQKGRVEAECSSLRERALSAEEGSRGLRGRAESLRGCVERAWGELVDAADLFRGVVRGVTERVAGVLEYLGIDARIEQKTVKRTIRFHR